MGVLMQTARPVQFTSTEFKESSFPELNYHDLKFSFPEFNYHRLKSLGGHAIQEQTIQKFSSPVLQSSSRLKRPVVIYLSKRDSTIGM